MTRRQCVIELSSCHVCVVTQSLYMVYVLNTPHLCCSDGFSLCSPVSLTKTNTSNFQFDLDNGHRFASVHTVTCLPSITQVVIITTIIIILLLLLLLLLTESHAKPWLRKQTGIEIHMHHGYSILAVHSTWHFFTWHVELLCTINSLLSESGPSSLQFVYSSLTSFPPDRSINHDSQSICL